VEGVAHTLQLRHRLVQVAWVQIMANIPINPQNLLGFDACIIQGAPRSHFRNQNTHAPYVLHGALVTRETVFGRPESKRVNCDKNKGIVKSGNAASCTRERCGSATERDSLPEALVAGIAPAAHDAQTTLLEFFSQIYARRHIAEPDFSVTA
jgi:hypothetical protein